MVRDGYYYGSVLALAAVVVGWLAGTAWALVPLVLATFFLWFFRDPDRNIPSDPGAVVSPADGKVSRVETVEVDGKTRKRISIFLNVFDVHVNRSPVSGLIRGVHYQPGKFGNAMNPECAEKNEQNTVTIDAEGGTVIFRQIAGLLARRIVFTKKIGETVTRGERVGMIKFSSRTDLLLDASAEIQVKAGDQVKGGSTIVAFLAGEAEEIAEPVLGRAQEGS